MTAEAIVIVGAGTAGVTAATTLRSSGFDGPITLIGEEAEHPYRRTALTKDLLAADLSLERIMLQKPAVWPERGIDLVRGVAVTAIDTPRRVVVCDDGREIGYRALVLATGADSARPDWLGGDVHSVRTLSDALAVRRAVDESGRLAVVGGGLIGLELAASAATHGASVDVVEAAERLLGRVAPAVVSDWFLRLHESHGASVRLGARVRAASARAITLDEGSEIEGPVVAAVGMTPNVTLAQAAGIETIDEGIIVDRCFATATPNVFAAGDAAALPDALTGRRSLGGHWFGATDHGRAVAVSVLAHLDGGRPDGFVDVPRAWTVQYGINVQMVGWPSVDGTVHVDGSLDDADASIRVSVDGRLVGAVAVGRAAAARELRSEIAVGLSENAVGLSM
ncbi:NAD(P)/FAD-dependent oxidoreductase [Gordonia liuliyuniae]|uniref:FAD-dependent oxidoreductase n=1 Tax=Gordonia liuliyuniae TaxID=2911517 RepID=A0ABS9ITC0_9ACTN|nr:FAD-dependent oxidoreductase [Gordonia liuliyuniae]MCF8588799.1 FAD-dependent oxidoreductase [Gordonia liuliyuniae]